MVTKILDVPLIKQAGRHYCGLACLSMVFAYWGQNISQEELSEFWGGPEHFRKYGVTNYEMISCAKKYGFRAYPRNNLGLEGIIKSIDRGVPVTARLRSIERGWGHYYVVEGYERHGRGYAATLFVNDPRYGKLYWKYDDFRKKWWIDRKKDKTKNYGIIIRPK